MKRFTKILLIVLTLTLLAALPVATSAEGEPELNIEAANLSFVDEISILYAVSAENADMADVKLLIWTEPKSSESEYVKGTEAYVLDSERYETVSGKSCKVFNCDKLGAHQMTDAVYARAYVEVGESAYYSDLSKYSVIRYAYNKLGYTGTATENETLRSTLEAMLAYGAAVQIYTDYKTDTLPTDRFYKVTVEGGALADGTTDGLYKEGDEIKVTNIAATKEHTITVIAHNAKVDAASGRIDSIVKVSEGLEFISLDDENCILVGIGTCKDRVINIPSTSPSGQKVIMIDHFVFEGEGIIKVNIPETVKIIFSGAFFNCTSLTEVTILPGLEEVMQDTFFGCTSLKRVNITDMEAWCNIRFGSGSGIMFDHSGAFANPLCNGADLYLNGSLVTDLKIPDTVTSLGDYAFYNCKSITTVSAGENLKEVGTRTFAECSNLKAIYIGKGIERILPLAFANCDINDVYYGGSMADLGNVNIHDFNIGLTSANIHFNYVPES